MIRQRTIRRAARATGIGLHGGRAVQLTIAPAEPDAGVAFHRLDLEPEAVVEANPENVFDTRLATTLGKGGFRVATVEHIMAAFAGLGIDNARVYLNADEVPIMDGSAAPFVELIRSAGIVEQPAPKRFLKMVREVAYTDGDATAKLSPYDGFRIEYAMRFDHPFFAGRRQCAAVEFSTAAFVADVSRARTFGFLADVEKLQAMDLALGGSLDNAVVVDENGVLNDEGLRCEDEFAKHKILDAIGDLYLLGHPVIGAFSGFQSGHTSNNGLLRRLLAERDAFEIVTFESAETPFELCPAA